MGLMATVLILQQGIQTTFGIALSGAYTHPHCELHGHKQRIELSPLGQSSSGSGLGNQSSLHKLLTRDLTDMLNEGEGKGRGRGGELLKLPTLRHNYTYSCIRVVPHTHSHLEEHVQEDDSLPQRLTDGVINGILLNTQVEDPVHSRR